jgi:hypothetical protein
LNPNAKSNAIRLAKGVLLGGMFAILTLAALVTFFVLLFAEDTSNYLFVAVSGIAVIGLSLATLWATGFWGRWGLAVFFALAPVVIILDSTINPFFPAGTVLAASVSYGLFRRSSSSNRQ